MGRAGSRVLFLLRGSSESCQVKSENDRDAPDDNTSDRVHQRCDEVLRSQ